MTEIDQTTRLLRDAEAYLSALHVHVARHDNIGADLTCGGCLLRDRIAAALPGLAGSAPVPPPADRAAADRERIAAALYRHEWPHKQVWEQALPMDRTDFLAQADAVLAELRRMADVSPAHEPTATLRELEQRYRPNTPPSRPEPRRLAGETAEAHVDPAERRERYAMAIHDAMEPDLSLVNQEPGCQALFARAAEAAVALADAEAQPKCDSSQHFPPHGLARCSRQAGHSAPHLWRTEDGTLCEWPAAGARQDGARP